jgi:hypothetical protein
MTRRHRLTATGPLGTPRRDHISRATLRLPHRRQIVNLGRDRIEATSQRLKIANAGHRINRIDETGP